MKSRETDLLHAVLAARSDDAPRMVYADWLLEQRSPAQRARGELIQVQCALARLSDEPSPERTALARRQGALLGEYELAWIDEAVPASLDRRRRWDSMHQEWSFERGFVADCAKRINASHNMEALPELLSRTPLTKLRLWFPGNELASFLDEAPELEQLEELSLELSGEATHTPPAALFATRRFPALRSLRFGWSNAGSLPPLAELLAAPIAERLEHLAVDWYQDVPKPRDLAAIVAAIAKAPLRTRLASLQLSNNAPLGKTALATLCKTAWPRLSSLGLEVADVGKTVRSLAALTSLESLSLSGDSDKIASRQLRVLLGALPKLTSLAIGWQRELAIDELLRADLSRFRALAFHHCRLGDPFAHAIAGATELTRLRELRLSYDGISSQGATELVGARHLGSLRVLDLSFNHKLAPKPFVTATHLEGLERLDLRGSLSATKAAQAIRTRFGGSAIIAEDDEASTRRRP